MIKAWCLSITVISDDEDQGDEVNPLPNKHDRMESSEIQVSSPIHTVDSPESKPIKDFCSKKQKPWSRFGFTQKWQLKKERLTDIS